MGGGGDETGIEVGLRHDLQKSLTGLNGSNFRASGGAAADNSQLIHHQFANFIHINLLFDLGRGSADHPWGFKDNVRLRAYFGVFGIHSPPLTGIPSQLPFLRIAHLERILKLGHLRLRGPRGAQDEFVLAAIAQTLRRLATLVARPPPRSGPVSCVA